MGLELGWVGLDFELVLVGLELGRVGLDFELEGVGLELDWMGLDFENFKNCKSRERRSCLLVRWISQEI